MYYQHREMSFIDQIYSKRYIHIASKNFRKRKYKILGEDNKKMIVKKSSKDEKLIYAFFLDIA